MHRQDHRWTTAVIDRREPLAPIETTVEPVLPTLTGIRAVVFDVYGTLVVSGSGDVGSANDNDRGQHLASALLASGLPGDLLPSVENLQSAIRSENERRLSEECPKPEIDIVAIWRRVIQQAGIADVSAETVVRLAAEYESRANPTWPMPAAANVLQQLAAAGLRLGIVSNAQIFTPLLVDQLSPESSGSSTNGQNFGNLLLGKDGIFDRNLCVFSNRFRQAKPGPRLFDVLVGALQRQNIEPIEAIYVGNDMLNDIWAASQAGLRTAWFAGDERSCRPRSDDPRCKNLQPDLVLTSLMQLINCLTIL